MDHRGMEPHDHDWRDVSWKRLSRRQALFSELIMAFTVSVVVFVALVVLIQDRPGHELGLIGRLGLSALAFLWAYFLYPPGRFKEKCALLRDGLRREGP